jgi:hypothetical protein
MAILRRLGWVVALVLAGCGKGGDATTASATAIATAAATAPRASPTAAEDPKASIEKGRALALPFCRKPIEALTHTDMPPQFAKLVASVRHPRFFDENKPADKELPFAARAGFVEEDDGHVILVISAVASDPCKADHERIVSAEREPVIMIKIEHPAAGVFRALNDNAADVAQWSVEGLYGWALEDKQPDGRDTDSAVMHGQTILKVTKYEKGKELTGEIIGCPELYLHDTDPPEKAASIKEFVIGPIAAIPCPAQ